MLYITTQLPYPPVSGGVIKSWRLVEHFSKSHELSVFCFLKGNDKNWVEQFEQRIKPKHFEYLEFEIRRSAKALVNSYIKNKTLNVYRNYSSKAKKTIAELSNEVDVLFVDHYEMFQYVPAEFKGQVILHQHNAEFVLWDRFADIEPSMVRKRLIQIESKRIRKVEKEYCEKADMVLAAPNDIEQLVSLGVDRNKFRETFHLGEDQLLSEPLVSFEKTEKSILFLGTLDWEANVDGLLYFINNIFPHVLLNEPETKLYIVGKNADKRLIKATEDEDNILLTGFVENVEPIYRKSRVFILPLRFGSGMKVKFLNALYRGIPTVSTIIGAEGIAVEHGNHAIVSDQDHDFIEGILDLIRDKNKWTSMQHQGRELAQSKYRWDDHLKQITEYLES